ncbi:PGF-CTERM sorting domain-containing protein [Haloferacaceae archaeon DSL9]
MLHKSLFEYMLRKKKTQIRAVLLTALMIGSLFAVAAPAYADHSSSVDGEFVDVDENVSVWDRSVLPLRADTSNAETEIDALPDVWIEQGDDKLHVERDSVGVFGAGDTVAFDFERRSGAQTRGLGLEDDRVQIHAIKLDDGVSTQQMPQTDAQLRTLLTSEEANERTEITEVDASDVTVEGGEFSFEHTFDESGMYLVTVSVTEKDGEGIMTEDGDVVGVDGQVNVVGAEGVAVQQASASLEDAESNPYEAGDDIDLTFDSGLDADDGVTHAVAVYNEETFANGEFTVVVPDDLDGDTTLDDLTVRHSIGTVDGVSDFEEVDRLGASAGMISGSGQFGLDTVLSYFLSQLDQPSPTFEPGDENLNASATGLSSDDSVETLTVGTLDSWEDGEYRWVYVAIGDDSDEFSTATGTFDIGDEKSDDEDGEKPDCPENGDESDCPPGDDDEKGDDEKGDDKDGDERDEDDGDENGDGDERDDEDDEDGEDEDSVPGFGAVVALVALLAAALIASRRS